MEAFNSSLEEDSRTLVVEYPYGTRLPSFTDVKEIFQHFGPLDNTRTCILPYSFSFYVVFLNKFHAQSAKCHLQNSSNSIFGDTDVKFSILDEYTSTEQQQFNDNDNVRSLEDIGEASSDVGVDFGGDELILEPMSPTPLPFSMAYNDEMEFKLKMLSLLRRCEIIVNSVKDRLGYMPYHPI